MSQVRRRPQGLDGGRGPLSCRGSWASTCGRSGWTRRRPTAISFGCRTAARAAIHVDDGRYAVAHGKPRADARFCERSSRRCATRARPTSSRNVEGRRGSALHIQALIFRAQAERGGARLYYQGRGGEIGMSEGLRSTLPYSKRTRRSTAFTPDRASISGLAKAAKGVLPNSGGDDAYCGPGGPGRGVSASGARKVVISRRPSTADFRIELVVTH